MSRVVDASPPLPPSVFLSRPRKDLPFPLGEPGSRIYARARQGVWHGVRALGLEEGDEVLTPAFHHGSEIEALRRAGLECRFYDGVEPDEGELEALLSARTKALYLIHYLGQPQDAPRWRRWASDRGLFLIEDGAQSWLAACPEGPVGSFGDLAVFCLYKTYGVPDGAAAVCARPLPAPRASAGRGPLVAAKLQASWIAGRWVAPARMRRSGGGSYDPEEDFALGDPDLGPSGVSTALIRRLATPATAERRRERFAILRAELGEWLSSAFADPGPGASPYVFPVEVDDKAAFVDRLRRLGVRAMNLWSVPHPSLPAEQYPLSAGLRRRVVGLPVHQEVQSPDLRGMVAEAYRLAVG